MNTRDLRKVEGDGPSVVIAIAPTCRAGLFRVTMDSCTLVKCSRQPRCDAARALHRLGYPDDTFVISYIEDSEHESMRGLLMDWRQLRVREDESGPRFAIYEPFAAARVSEKRAKPTIRREGGEQVVLTNPSRYRARPRG
jgi:hypothetical protein